MLEHFHSVQPGLRLRSHRVRSRGGPTLAGDLLNACGYIALGKTGIAYSKNVELLNVEFLKV